VAGVGAEVDESMLRPSPKIALVLLIAQAEMATTDE